MASAGLNLLVNYSMNQPQQGLPSKLVLSRHYIIDGKVGWWEASLNGQNKCWVVGGDEKGTPVLSVGLTFPNSHYESFGW